MKDKLILEGFRLIKSDIRNDIYVFENDEKLTQKLEKYSSSDALSGVATSNTLTF